MLIKIRDDFYLGENAIVAVSKNEHGAYEAETVTGTKLILDEDVVEKLTKKVGRPKRENDGSDK